MVPEIHQQSAASKPSLARPVAAALAIGLVVGIVIGWASFRSPSGSESGPTVLYDENAVTSLYARVSPAVVEITVSRPGILREAAASGSGFLVDAEGHIVTNYHVVEGTGDISVRLSDGRTLEATKLGESRADDLAVLQVDPEEVSGVDPLPMADSSEVTSGEMAIAVGSPFSQYNSVSVGVVSGLGRTRPSGLRRPIPDMVQTDAALNPGNSGGPLLNRDGEVIGVNSSVQLQSSVQTGVGFAISSNTVKGILANLMIPGEFKRPWIGIQGSALTKRLSEAMDLPSDTGIYVQTVCNNSPAQKARLRGELRLDCDNPATQDALGSGAVRRTGFRGDVIIAVDGDAVSSVGDMVSYFNTLIPGDKVTLTIIRENSFRDVDVTLAEWLGN